MERAVVLCVPRVRNAPLDPCFIRIYHRFSGPLSEVGDIWFYFNENVTSQDSPSREGCISYCMIFDLCLKQFMAVCLMNLDMLQLGYVTALQTQDCLKGCSAKWQRDCFIVHKHVLVGLGSLTL